MTPETKKKLEEAILFHPIVVKGIKCLMDREPNNVYWVFKGRDDLVEKVMRIAEEP